MGGWGVKVGRVGSRLESAVPFCCRSRLLPFRLRSSSGACGRLGAVPSVAMCPHVTSHVLIVFPVAYVRSRLYVSRARRMRRCHDSNGRTEPRDLS